MALAAETSFVVKLIQSHSVTKSFFEILQFPISSFQHAQQFARYVCDFKELLHSNLFFAGHSVSLHEFVLVMNNVFAFSMIEPNQVQRDGYYVTDRHQNDSVVLI